MSQATLMHAPRERAASKATPTSFRPDIQGLRAVAVLAVVADHLLGYPVGGFVGVDVFFVISGFLITGLLLREQENKGRISFANFYRRRIRRIVPVAVIVLSITVVSSWALFSTSRAKSISWDGLYSLIFGANWHLAAVGTDYMQAEGPVSPIQHFWSLAVEEQFYVVWPWLIVFVLGFLARRMSLGARVARHILAGVFAAVIIATFMYALWETREHPTVAYFSTVSRTWELAVGAFLAVISGAFSSLSTRMRTTLGYLGLAGIAWSLWFITSEMAFPGPWAAVPVLATALVIAAGTGGEQRYLYPLTNPVSGYIGNISYSLYLWHFPVIILMEALVTRDDHITWSVMILGMFALSIASYHFIEDPIRKSAWLEPTRKKGRRRGEKLFDATTANAGLGVLILVLAMLTTIAFTRTAEDVHTFDPPPLGEIQSTKPSNGPDLETPAGQLAAELATASLATSWPSLSPSVDDLQNHFAPEWVVDKCLTVDESNLDRCKYGDLASNKTAVVLGDSVAISWMPGLRESLGKQGWNIQLLTKGQCPAVPVSVSRPEDGEDFADECLDHQRWALAKVQEIQPDLVIVNSSNGTMERMVGIEGASSLASEWKRATVQKLEELKDSTGGDVVLLSVAMQGANLADCATRVSKPVDCRVSNPSYMATVSTEKSAADMVPDVRFVSTVPWFCTSGNLCPAFAGTTPIFTDGAHITPEYSTKLAPVLGPALLGETK